MPPPTRFVMTLARNDVSGERGEGYMLIPLAARTKNPSFWGWPGKYPTGATYPERQVRVREGGQVVDQRIYHQDTKSEFRLGTGLYFAGASSDAVLEVLRDPDPGVDFEYRIHEPSSPDYADLKRAANQWTQGTKRWGYIA